MVFALSYSVATAFIIFMTNRKSIIITYALLDTIGVFLYYFTTIPIHYGGIYFALYTGILIASTMFLNGSEYLVDRIIEMKEKGMTQREAAEKFNISESKVSRILKRTRNIV